MALTTVATVQSYIGLDASTDSQFLTQLLPAVESALLKVLDRNLPQQTYTDFYGGTGNAVLRLREWPATPPVLSGTLASGSAVVTGFTATTVLGPGLTVTGTGIPQSPATTVLSVDSLTQLTLSAPATASGATPLTFLPTVYEDSSAAWGSAPGAFAPTALLVYGTDFSLVLDGYNGAAETGRLFRIGGVWGQRWESKRGLLTAGVKRGAGNVKVTACLGYATIPPEILLAVWECCAQLRAARRRGRLPYSENLGSYNYILDPLINEYLQLGSVQWLISKYRRISPRYERLG